MRFYFLVLNCAYIGTLFGMWQHNIQAGFFMFLFMLRFSILLDKTGFDE